MFETDVILWLQAQFSPKWDMFFLSITHLGYEIFLQAFLVFLVFGLNVRRGFILAQAIIWTGAVIEALKLAFAYPRPFMVDSRVIAIGASTNLSPLTDGAAQSFWSRLPDNSIDTARSVYASDSWGIPSGHAAGAVVIWGSLMSWYRKKTVWCFCAALIILIPLSRLYLGMHFLADLLAGLLVGLSIHYLLIKKFFHAASIHSWLFSGQPKKFLSRDSALFLCVFVLPGCAALFTSVSLDSITLILGSNLGFYGVWLRGLPFASATLKDDALRLAIAYPMLFIILIIDHQTDPWLAANVGKVGAGIQEILLNGGLIFLGIELLVKMGFMTRHDQ